ncbi:MAG: zinc metallopeptidase [Lachnospiraceae bacterium]|nr:zinc metallopeptidase [Lachnospiraceae bacterium]
MFYYDYTYILVLIGVVLTMIVQGYMTSTFNKYQQVESRSGLNTLSAAKMILSANGINDVNVGHVSGNLTDHYAPTKKELNLSDTTYESRSIASIGVAAHECGHAIQDHTDMWLLHFQMSIVPVVNFASKLSIPVIFVGIILSSFNLMQVGIILFTATLIYQLITLPIEFNASKNAIRTLRDNGMMDEDELYGVRKVLNAAALTYVAAAATTMLQLLRFIIIANSSRRRS